MPAVRARAACRDRKSAPRNVASAPAATTQSNPRARVVAEDGDDIAGESGGAHLSQADHAHSGEKCERQGDDAEDQRIGPDLKGEEGRGDQRIDDQQNRDDHGERRADAGGAPRLERAGGAGDAHTALMPAAP